MQKHIITTRPGMPLDTALVYYPELDKSLWTLIDLDSGLLLAIEEDALHPWHPWGGLTALNAAIEQGLTPGVQVAAFRGVQIDGDLYCLDQGRVIDRGAA